MADPHEVDPALRDALLALSEGCLRVAGTLRWDGYPNETSDALVDLGPLFVAFGEALGGSR